MRTLVQIDVQNLFFSAKDIDKKIDFYKIKDHFCQADEEVVGLIAYMVRGPENKGEKFETFMKSIGYTLSIKTALVSYKSDGSRQYLDTDQDIPICIDCMKKVDDFDKWVLMSGDGDFIDLCREMKKRGKVVEVWALPGVSFNKRLCDWVDAIHFLNEKFFFEEKESDTKRETNEKSRSNLQTI